MGAFSIMTFLLLSFKFQVSSFKFRFVGNWLLNIRYWLFSLLRRKLDFSFDLNFLSGAFSFSFHLPPA